MIRTLVMVAAILFAGAASAQQPGPMSAWPPGAGSSRSDAPTVSSRAIGLAPGTPTYRGRLNVQRRGATREEASAAMEKAIADFRAIGGVDLRNVRRDGTRTQMEPAQMQPSTPSNPLPAIPPRGQMVPVIVETASIEVEAKTRQAIFDWASQAPSPPSAAPNTPVYQQPPIITERTPDDDPAWALATRNALLAAERDARMAATAAGGELGRLVGMWVERLPYAVEGNAQVTVTAEYEIARPRR